MAGAKGYSSYRGRGGKGKIFLAVLLILVIAAACLVIFFQQHVVYDGNGRPQIVLPWQNGEPESAAPLPEENPPEVDLIVQAPEPEEPSRSLTLSLNAAPLTMEAWSAWQAGVQNQERAAVAVTLKDSAGKIYFDAARAISGAVQTKADTAGAISAAVSTDGLQVTARFSCLHDARAANSNVRAMGLRNTGGYIFYDGNNSQWLDPSKPAAREYVCGLAAEIAALGVDEILVTDLSYPTEGKVHKIDYNGDGPIEENLAQLLRELRAVLEPLGVTLSVELPESVVSLGFDEISGQKLSVIAPLVDRVYSVTAADRIEALSSAVAAVSESTVFVPELPAGTPTEQLTGMFLLLPAEG